MAPAERDAPPGDGRLEQTNVVAEVHVAGSGRRTPDRLEPVMPGRPCPRGPRQPEQRQRTPGLHGAGEGFGVAGGEAGGAHRPDGLPEHLHLVPGRSRGLVESDEQIDLVPPNRSSVSKSTVRMRRQTLSPSSRRRAPKRGITNRYEVAWPQATITRRSSATLAAERAPAAMRSRPMVTARWRVTPAGERITPRRLRSNSGVSTSCSSSAMRRLTAGCRMPSSSAAAVKLSWRAAASNARSALIRGSGLLRFLSIKTRGGPARHPWGRSARPQAAQPRNGA